MTEGLKDVKELRKKEGESNFDTYKANYGKIFHKVDKNLAAYLGESAATMFDVISNSNELFNDGKKDDGIKSNWFFWSVKSVEGVHGFSETRQYDLLKSLEEKGLIEKKTNRRKRYICIVYSGVTNAIQRGMDIRSKKYDDWMKSKADGHNDENNLVES